MAWPQENYPPTTKYAPIEFVRSQPIILITALLIFIYMLINFVFGGIQYYLQPFKVFTSFWDCQYFAFVTGLTVGYGDIAPQDPIGKLVMVVHGITATTYFATMIALLGIKFLSPYRTIHFSQKILFDGKGFCFRLINSHRSLLVNPEVRISVVLHCTGNVIAPTINVAKIDNLHWLDNHDFVLGFPAQQIGLPDLLQEWETALSCQGEQKSRFKIRITITGNYGFQQYYQVKSYDALDVSNGSRFAPIQYNDEDKRQLLNIRFQRFGNFWNDFNTIVE